MKKLTDRSFVKLAYEKGLIIKELSESLPNGWYWMVVEESAEGLVVEIRHVVTGDRNIVEYTQ